MRRSSPLGCLIYTLMGIVQIAATIVGFEAWWGWNGFFAIVGAIFVGYIPILGTITGIMGAIEGWGWSPVWAILLFCWPLAIYLAAFLCNIIAIRPVGENRFDEKMHRGSENFSNSFSTEADVVDVEAHAANDTSSSPRYLDCTVVEKEDK